MFDVPTWTDFPDRPAGEKVGASAPEIPIAAGMPISDMRTPGPLVVIGTSGLSR
jgi:hypothetical protein